MNKYDFVTVALRDIAIGLGFTTNFTADVNNKKLNITNGRLTPFESLVMDALGTNDPYSAYTNATNGKVEISLKTWGGISFDSLSIYAPKTWVNGKSLRFMIPDDNPISKLLTHDFGKGYIMRDLSGVNWDNIFCGALDWRPDMTTGVASGSVTNTGTNSDVLPFKGKVTLSFDGKDKKASEYKGNVNEQNPDEMTTVSEYSSTAQTMGVTKDYCKKYNEFSPDGPSIYPGLSLSVLKKDGTWDCIYKTYYEGYEPITITIEDLNLNCNESEYARSTSGGLRYRLTKCKSLDSSSISENAPHEYHVKYFTRDYIPPKATIRFNKIYSLQNNKTAKEADLIDDDGFIDVKIGIKDIEGTNRIVVEQLDEGETVPFQYEVSDFRKGYFIANLDTECTTKLTVISYNDNGYQRSNTITVPALGKSSNPLRFNLAYDNIKIIGIAEAAFLTGNVCYSISSLSKSDKIINKGRIYSDEIDIGDLSNDIYVLTIYDDSHTLGSFKFKK